MKKVICDGNNNRIYYIENGYLCSGMKGIRTLVKTCFYCEAWITWGEQMKTIDELVCKFNEIYPNLPLGERRNTIAVVKGEPLSWKIVKLEISTPCPTENWKVST